MQSTDKGHWNKDLMCLWLSIQFMPPNGIIIKLPENHCADFSGSVRFSKKLVPDVDQIETWSGEELEASYRLDKHSKKWLVTFFLGNGAS